MTTYHIRLCPSHSEHADVFRRTAHALRNEPEVICDEIARLHGRAATGTEQVCAKFLARATGPDWKLLETHDGPEVTMCALGARPLLTAREEARRAYCRLFMARMHREGIEVSISVT